MTKQPLLEILRGNAKYCAAELAELVSMTEAEVSEQLVDWEKDGTILGYHAVVDRDKMGEISCTAFIEVKLTPERGGGFDRLAMRIARFDQVTSCYLLSGSYDLMVMVDGKSLREVASFVSEKLATVEGVISTATHFRLKTYKENGFVFGIQEEESRLPVTP